MIRISHSPDGEVITWKRRYTLTSRTGCEWAVSLVKPDGRVYTTSEDSAPTREEAEGAAADAMNRILQIWRVTQEGK